LTVSINKKKVASISKKFCPDCSGSVELLEFFVGAEYVDVFLVGYILF